MRWHQRDANKRAELQQKVKSLFAHYGETAVKHAVQELSEREASLLIAFIAARRGD